MNGHPQAAHPRTAARHVPIAGRKKPSPVRRVPVAAAIAAALAAGLSAIVPGVAHADAPGGLPQMSTEKELRFAPVWDYDSDSCYPSPAIGPDGRVNGGLEPSGSITGKCRRPSHLTSANLYSRKKCNNGWCAYAYSIYFEKDQVNEVLDIGHRHDFEQVVVWVQNDQVKFVSSSHHRNYRKQATNEVSFLGSRPKIVYHKEGAGSHTLRLAGPDERPENETGQWHRPTLVGWDHFPQDEVTVNGEKTKVRDVLARADFGAASFWIRDANFPGLLEKSKPDGIEFDPNGNDVPEPAANQNRIVILNNSNKYNAQACAVLTDKNGKVNPCTPVASNGGSGELLIETEAPLKEAQIRLRALDPDTSLNVSGTSETHPLDSPEWGKGGCFTITGDNAQSDLRFQRVIC